MEEDFSSVGAMVKTVLITGCSSGIGNATAWFFAGKGWNVAASMRTPSCAAGSKLEELPNVLVAKLDVTNRDSIDKVVAETIRKFGSLDVVINNAGYALNGPSEFATKDQVLSQFETNVYGPLAVTQAVLSHFRAKRSGLVVNVGSLVAKTPFPFMSIYAASKFALDGMTEALNLELVPVGVRIKIVHPGVVETPHMSNIDKINAECNGVDSCYSGLMGASEEAFPGLFGGLVSSAAHIAGTLFDAATDGSDKVRYFVGKDCTMFLQKKNSMNDEEWETEMLKDFNLKLGS